MFFFFFKQKTAYEMRISDWSSDVCSSDLLRAGAAIAGAAAGGGLRHHGGIRARPVAGGAQPAGGGGAAGQVDDGIFRSGSVGGCRGNAGGRTSADRCAAKSGHADTPQLGDRRVSEGLIVVLPERPGAEPLWTRVANGAVVRKGAGTNWLAEIGRAHV